MNSRSLTGIGSLASPPVHTHSLEKCVQAQTMVAASEGTHSSESKVRSNRRPRGRRLKYIGRRRFGLSGSYQQGYSTAYNAWSHIKVVCNGYILTHISN